MYQDFAQPAAPQQQPAQAPKQQQQQRMSQPQSKVHPEAASNVVSLTPKSDQKAAAAAAEDSKVLSYSTGTKKSQLVNPPPQPPTGKLSYASMVAGGRAEPPKKAPAAAPAATSATPSRPGSFRPPAEHSKAAAAPDFSFEASQAGLQNLTTAQAEVFKAIQDKSFYSKSSSFFDDISCDAKDGKADDSRLRNERSWNVETFGVPAPPSSYGTGYGSGRGGSSSRGASSRGGRGGRGGYRGGRGGSASAKA
jgi:protein LSM14